MIFTHLQQTVEPLMTKIHNLPFNKELANGLLPKETFIFYLEQDALYLTEYAKALSLIAARLGNNQHIKTFMEFSLGAIQAEQELHSIYFTSYQVNPTTKQTPACFAYTNYLLKMAALASVEEAIAALLPCPWIYAEVGQYMVQTCVSGNPYQEWIDIYASQEFADSTTKMINVLNQLTNNVNQNHIDKILAAFIYSTKLEWLFWHSAYHIEQWQI